KNPVYLRYALVSDDDVQYDGAHLDDVSVRCLDASFTGDVYSRMSGTSMAAPHVAGAAALLFAAAPEAGPATVRDALLSGAEAKPSLAGKTVTGGRLNAKASLDLLPPTIRFTDDTYSTTEDAGTATITVERLGDTAWPVSVGYTTSDGSATDGADYTAASGRVSFPAGGRTATVTVPIHDDGVLEGTETVNLSLTDPDGAALSEPSTATLAIADNETPALASFASTLRTVPENAGVVHVTVTRGGDTTVPAAVTYRRTSGTATPGSDFELAPGTLQFAAGETSKTFPVTIVNDAAREVAETIVLSLASASPITEVGANGSMTLRIAPSDQRPDALVSTALRSGYAGDNVYNTTGRNQTKVVQARRTQVRTFYVRVQNDGNVTNTFKVQGSAPAAGSTVTYLSGSTHVTKAMRSKAGLQVRLSPGKFKVITVRVKVLAKAAIGSRKPATVRATWSGDGTRTDLAKAVVKVVR
ncbi:MAG TPA: Calx-beta domain-containing protein, partial [Nocardioidaceae bacterium]|nr:Calx-beta domain-containing protein [Nocardioidaceae bacterium]